MRKFLLLFLLLIFTSIGIGQVVKKPAASTTKPAKKGVVAKKTSVKKKAPCNDGKPPIYYTITRKPLTGPEAQKSKVTMLFINPAGQPVKSNLKLTINNDSITPALDNSGNYSLMLESKKYKFSFIVKFWEPVVTDSIPFKPGEEVIITVRFEANEQKLPAIHYSLDKPVIYVYPEENITVRIELFINGSMTYSYPKYENGWLFTASPTGNIELNHKNYDYLFWEGSSSMTGLKIDKRSGFMVRSDTLTEFFERSLAKAGLNEKETQDFITYWVPKMQINEYNFCHFIFTNEYDQLAAIKIEPAPKNLIRVFVLWAASSVEKKHSIVPQTFPKFSRSGYTVIEWGGSEARELFEESK